MLLKCKSFNNYIEVYQILSISIKLIKWNASGIKQIQRHGTNE